MNFHTVALAASLMAVSSIGYAQSPFNGDWLVQASQIRSNVPQMVPGIPNMGSNITLHWRINISGNSIFMCDM